MYCIPSAIVAGSLRDMCFLGSVGFRATIIPPALEVSSGTITCARYLEKVSCKPETNIPEKGISEKGIPAKSSLYFPRVYVRVCVCDGDGLANRPAWTLSRKTRASSASATTSRGPTGSHRRRGSWRPSVTSSTAWRRTLLPRTCSRSRTDTMAT